MKERQHSSRDEPEHTDEGSQEFAELTAKIDEIVGEIERQLAADVKHAESSRLELERTLKEIRLKQEAIDKTLRPVG